MACEHSPASDHKQHPLHAGVLFHANLLVDVSFLVDLGLQPFMGFWDEHRDVWVMDLAAIRARYLRGWATVDLIAGCPYDVISVLVQDHWIGRLQVPIRITTLIQVENAVVACDPSRSS